MLGLTCLITTPFQLKKNLPYAWHFSFIISVSSCSVINDNVPTFSFMGAYVKSVSTFSRLYYQYYSQHGRWRHESECHWRNRHIFQPVQPLITKVSNFFPFICACDNGTYGKKNNIRKFMPDLSLLAYARNNKNIIKQVMNTHKTFLCLYFFDKWCS